MRKTLMAVVVAVTVIAVAAPLAQAANSKPGGAEGFFTGCCFGLRVGADYNDLGTGDREFVSWFLVGLCLGPRAQMDYQNGKEFHWREICRLIPYIGGVFAIWDGIDISSGKGRVELQDTYGAMYY
jgi:hypothetical protein